MKKHHLLSRVSHALLAAVGVGSLMLSHEAAAVNILTQKFDQYRSGANTNETILTLSNVNSSQFGKLYSYKVDGYVFAQPLYVSGLTINGGTHNVLFVVSMEDSVYAFDADSNTTLWHTNFTGGNIVPVPITDITSGNNDLNIHNDVGIESTPVIDLSSGTIYLLARTKNTSTTTYIQTLHALSITTGAEKFGGPEVINTNTGGGFDPKMQNQRPGLAEANGNIYICWGSHEDFTPYHGWMMAYNATNLTSQVAEFNTTPSGSQSAIWMAGQAPAIDSSGNLYVITGNGDWDGVTKWGESILKMSPTLTVSDWFTESDVAWANANDQDLGSGGAMLFPNPAGYPSTAYVIGGGKEGKLYILSKTAGMMGHYTTNDTAAYQWFQASTNVACTRHIHGSPIYWDSGLLGQMLYVWGENGSGQAFKYNGTTFNTTPQSSTAATAPIIASCGMPGGILTLSANGNTNGIVWASCLYSGDALHDIVPGILRALNANNINQELWNSYQDQARDDTGLLAKYCPPVPVNGKVYMSSFNSNICVFGLLGSSGSLANGVYKMINLNSGLALDAEGQNTTNGTPIQQYTYNGGANQEWAVTNSGGVYTITGVQSGLVLDVVGQGTANGTLLDLWTSNGGGNQQWNLSQVQGASYTLQGVQSAKLMEVLGSATTNKASVDIWSATGGSNQVWSFAAP